MWFGSVHALSHDKLEAKKRKRRRNRKRRRSCTFVRT
jgi:hypothetical protein